MQIFGTIMRLYSIEGQRANKCPWNNDKTIKRHEETGVITMLTLEMIQEAKKKTGRRS